MAGRNLPESAGSDGVRYVGWSRSRRLGFVCMSGCALFVAASAGVGATLAWQRYGGGTVAVTPASYEAVPAVAGEAADGATDLRREVMMLRHERDAARERINALVRLTAQMKAELVQTQAGTVSGAAPVAVPATELEKAQARVALLETELASARDVGKAATDAALSERDRAWAGLAEGRAAMLALRASHHRLADRAEQALAARDDEAARLLDELAATVETARRLEVGMSSPDIGREAMRADLDGARGQRDQDLQAVHMRRDGLDAGPDAAQLAGSAAATAVAAVAGAGPALQSELAEALARIKDLDLRVAASERRNVELERYVAERAPSPPAPRPMPD